MNRLRAKAHPLSVENIRIGTDAMTLECGMEISGEQHSYLIHTPRESSVPKTKGGMLREQVHETPGKSDFVGKAPKASTGKEPGGRPLAVLFSTRRAVPSERTLSTGSSKGDVMAAFADAFSNRELQLGYFAEWIRVQDVLKTENPAARRALAALKDAVSRFLPEYSDLRASGDKRPTLEVDHGKTILKVRQLSDGERGMLALVLDLTKRLSQANRKMSSPAANAESIVLIDELDLHLHPKWQRQIVKNLTAAFPNCQFIATTHSPQIIGEVEHERIQIIANGQVFSPTHSFGVDSSRVLQEIMDVAPRTVEVQMLVTLLSQEIGNKRYETARKLLGKLVEHVGENDPEVTQARTFLEFMEDEK
jgi:predicted ATP-binding protein involved in virulence